MRLGSTGSLEAAFLCSWSPEAVQEPESLYIFYVQVPRHGQLMSFAKKSWECTLAVVSK